MSPASPQENMDDKKSILICVGCREMFNLRDVSKLDYFPDTGLCFSCYEKMKRGDGCFGKRTKKDNEGKVKSLGYKKDCLECSEICPDRVYCPLFLEGEIYQLRGKEMSPMLRGMLDRGDIE